MAIETSTLKINDYEELEIVDAKARDEIEQIKEDYFPLTEEGELTGDLKAKNVTIEGTLNVANALELASNGEANFNYNVNVGNELHVEASANFNELYTNQKAVFNGGATFKDTVRIALDGDHQDEVYKLTDILKNGIYLNDCPGDTLMDKLRHVSEYVTSNNTPYILKSGIYTKEEDNDGNDFYCEIEGRNFRLIGSLKKVYNGSDYVYGVIFKDRVTFDMNDQADNNITIENITFEKGLYIYGDTTNYKFVNCIFYPDTSTTDKVDRAPLYFNRGINADFVNCKFYGEDSTSISYNRIDNFNFENCEFLQNNNSSQYDNLMECSSSSVDYRTENIHFKDCVINHSNIHYPVDSNIKITLETTKFNGENIDFGLNGGDSVKVTSNDTSGNRIYLNNKTVTKDLYVGGAFDENGEYYENGDNSSRLVASGTVEILGGEIRAYGSSLHVDEIYADSNVRIDGTVRINNETVIDNSLDVKSKIRAREGAKIEGTLDMVGNDVKNIQSLEVEGTSNLKHDVYIRQSGSSTRTDENRYKLSDILEELTDGGFKNRYVVGKHGGDTFAEQLQATIDACPDGGTVFIPKGEYELSNEINIHKNITILGDRNKPTITCTVSDCDYMIYVQGEANIPIDFRCKNIIFMKNDSCEAGYIRLGDERSYTTQDSYIINCDFYNADKAGVIINPQSVRKIYIEKCFFDELALDESYSESGTINCESIFINNSTFQNGIMDINYNKECKVVVENSTISSYQGIIDAYELGSVYFINDTIKNLNVDGEKNWLVGVDTANVLSCVDCLIDKGTMIKTPDSEINEISVVGCNKYFKVDISNKVDIESESQIDIKGYDINIDAEDELNLTLKNGGILNIINEESDIELVADNGSVYSSGKYIELNGTESVAIKSLSGTINLNSTIKYGTPTEISEDRYSIPIINSDGTTRYLIVGNTTNDLVNYYLKSETYSQEEINQLISSIPKFTIQPVDALPTENVSTTTVYLLKSGDDTNNLYTEYIYANGVWEILGTQALDIPTKFSDLEQDKLEVATDGTIILNADSYIELVANSDFNIKAGEGLNIVTDESDMWIATENGRVEISGQGYGVDITGDTNKGTDSEVTGRIKVGMTNGVDITSPQKVVIEGEKGVEINGGDGGTSKFYIDDLDFIIGGGDLDFSTTDGAAIYIEDSINSFHVQTTTYLENGLIIPSSTPDSTKKFKITVDDDGIFATTNTADNSEVKYNIPTVTNDLTDELKTQYDAAYEHSVADHAPTDAQANVIESITVNGVAQEVTEKTVNITVPTDYVTKEVADLTNYYSKTEVDNLISSLTATIEALTARVAALENPTTE